MLNELSSTLKASSMERQVDVLRSFPLPEDFILEAFSPLIPVMKPLHFKTVKLGYFFNFTLEM